MIKIKLDLNWVLKVINMTLFLYNKSFLELPEGKGTTAAQLLASAHLACGQVYLL
jgi:hypothetical protein